MVNKCARCFVTVLLCLLCTASVAASDKDSAKFVKRLLANQGFTGVLTGKVQLVRLGSLACNDNVYTAFYYEWEETNPPGLAVHQIKRVIFMAKPNKYIGSYVVEDRPNRMEATAILFDYPKESGNAIACDAGGLPKTVVLHGSQQLLAK